MTITVTISDEPFHRSTQNMTTPSGPAAQPVIIPATATTPAFTPLPVTPRSPIELSAYEYVHAMDLLPTNHVAQITAADLRTALDPVYQVLMQLNEQQIKAWVSTGAITFYDSKGNPSTPYPDPVDAGDLLVDTDTGRIVAFNENDMWVELDTEVEPPGIPDFNHGDSYPTGRVVWYEGVQYRAASPTTPPEAGKSVTGTFGPNGLPAVAKTGYALTYPSRTMPGAGEMVLFPTRGGEARLRVNPIAPDGTDMTAALAAVAVGDLLAFTGVSSGSDLYFSVRQYPGHEVSDDAMHMIQASPPIYEFDVREGTSSGGVVAGGFRYVSSGTPDIDPRWTEVRKDPSVDAKIEALTTGLEHGEAVTSITNAPPALAALDPDELFIVGPVPTGLFVGHANELALWSGSVWEFTPAKVNETHLVEATRTNTTFTNLGTWVVVSAAGGANLVGEIVMWPGAAVPADFLLCDGATFDRAAFPALFAALGADSTPNLTGQFIRAGTPDLTPQQWTTGGPRNTFITSGQNGHDHGGHTGTESQSHNHIAAYHAGKVGWEGDSADHYLTNTSHGLESDEGRKLTDNERQTHTHPISGDGGHSHTISDGGDPETAPDHVVLAFIIRSTA